jgi:hypothetical protein
MDCKVNRELRGKLYHAHLLVKKVGISWHAISLGLLFSLLENIYLTRLAGNVLEWKRPCELKTTKGNLFRNSH